MDRLSLNDPPAQGPAGPNANSNQPQGPSMSTSTATPAQLPAQMFTTAAQLLDLTDSEPLLARAPLPLPTSPSPQSQRADGSVWAQQHLSLGLAEQDAPIFRRAAVDVALEKLMVSLRDGRKFIGVLRSWDQYANLVLQDTIERIFVQQYYADIPRGMFLVRGENVLLLGEIDLDKDDYIPEPFREAPPDLVTSLQKKERDERARRDKLKQTKLQALGFEGENSGEILT